MKNVLVTCCVFLVGSFGVIATAASLPANSPFYNQLVAMGYTLEDVEGESTIATRNNNALLISQEPKWTWVARFWNAKPFDSLTKEQQLKALSIINEINAILSTKLYYTGDNISCVNYIYGEYSPRTFGTAVSDIEGCNAIFDRNPELLEFGKSE
jgi:hypothetical protein